MTRTTLRYAGTALVTGASSGLGEHFARFLARNGMDVVLVARREAELAALASELGEQHRVRAVAMPCDLTDGAARRKLLDDLAAQGVEITGLVNNAGFGYLGEFVDQDADRLTAMIELNCVALTDLVRACLPGMLARDEGFIINVASTAAFQPIPTMAAYAASKAYVRSLTQALWDETRASGVRVIAVSPGPTETEFFQVAGDEDSMTGLRRTPEQVVQTAFRGLQQGRPEVVDGVLNGIQATIASKAPVRLALPIARRAVK